ncbi:LuxR C-terminal-related transcriptional regulator [Dictyobacter aurantiacus]|uniref:HTH-type transcriptional regulator MalT n=1 Tax=Dictyobacter aurantiacus TaxID=1936993 RepID=A0A401ZM71_9CHLR|nr:LuxR C-terminal-related transcriptional regulator [Dictyobacter aurantiacus]GCE07971.1 HTH-type transcriptional regulator MalT [Dictyobacter aurantiacus]
MPRTSPFMLRWSGLQCRYELYEGDSFLLPVPGPAWLDWLHTHRSFSFQNGQQRFNMLKETRKRTNEAYWYAYQRQGKRVVKRYAGKSTDITTSRLEEICMELQGMLSVPLLEPKFQLPRVTTSLIPRERLFTLLDSGLERRLILLSAPAGSGKTTLISQWQATRKTRQHFPALAWLSLDANDNDPVRFWRYVMTACRVFQPDPGQSALEQLALISQHWHETHFLDTILTYFLNALAHIAESGILVLEDYHLITAPTIHQTLAFFLDHLPHTMHLVIITRSTPALPLTRLRIRDELCEIGPDGLRFRPDEVETFLRPLVATPLTPQALQQIDAQLEGWAAALRLFALSLQKNQAQETIEQQLSSFVRNQLPLQEYFIDEVLNTLPPALQTFLLSTSMLNRLTPSLCDAVTGKRNSASLLHSLAQRGLFLEQLEGPGPWYRYHPLFAEALRAEARHRVERDEMLQAARQASLWYLQQHMLNEAIEAALHAEELALAAEIMVQMLNLQGFNDLQEVHTLRRWLEQLPEQELYLHPLLCLSYAWVLSLSFVPSPPSSAELAHIEQLLLHAEECWRAQDNKVRLGEVFTFRAQHAIWHGEVERAADYAHQALGLLPAEAQHWRGMSLNILGIGELSAGQIIRARETLQEAQAIWTALHHLHGARSCRLALGLVYFEQGTLQLASSCYQAVLQEARDLGDVEDLSPALLGQARLFYEWNNLDAAERAAQEAIALAEQLQSQILQTQAALVIARIAYARDQKSQAQQRLAALLTRLSDHQPLTYEVQLCQIQFLLLENDLVTAQYQLSTLISRTSDLSEPLREQLGILQARLLVRQKDFSAASELLSRLQEKAQMAGRLRAWLEMQLLVASIQYAQRRTLQVRQTLQTILIHTHTENYHRLFLDQGEDAAVLLRSLQRQIYEPALARYLQSVLQAFGPNQAPFIATPEPLSRQEQRVLRLLLADLSYPQIARELVVSLNTVKTQVRSIYHKLGVHTRRELQTTVQRRRLS